MGCYVLYTHLEGQSSSILFKCSLLLKRYLSTLLVLVSQVVQLIALLHLSG